ncbi:uncharacterized protein LOC115831486 [Nomascus leucogenys]|uniref:uncharacterized protein LOC115831486 n=1 Tax=Nomascus leucogenys TaxID=61853 RepID=UPI00122D8BF7|nr:uncharacterized protein LOC115831486 [Nomascus leucogenys]
MEGPETEERKERGRGEEGWEGGTGAGAVRGPEGRGRQQVRGVDLQVPACPAALTQRPPPLKGYGSRSRRVAAAFAAVAPRAGTADSAASSTGVPARAAPRGAPGPALPARGFLAEARRVPGPRPGLPASAAAACIERRCARRQWERRKRAVAGVMRRPRREAQGPRLAGRCSSSGSSRSSSTSPSAACAGCAPSALCPKTSPSRRYGTWRFFSIYPIMVELKVIAYLKSTTADVLYPSHCRYNREMHNVQ